MSEIHENLSVSGAAPFSHTEPTSPSHAPQALRVPDLPNLPDRDEVFAAGHLGGTTAAARPSTNLPVTRTDSGTVDVGKSQSKAVSIAKMVSTKVMKATVSVAKWVDNHKMLVGVTLGSIGVLLLATGFAAPIGALFLLASIGLPLLAHVIAKHAKEGTNAQANEAATRGVQGHSEALEHTSHAAPQLTSQRPPVGSESNARSHQPSFDPSYRTYPSSSRTSSPDPQFRERDDGEWDEYSLPNDDPSTRPPVPPRDTLPGPSLNPRGAVPPPPTGGSGTQPPPLPSRDTPGQEADLDAAPSENTSSSTLGTQSPPSPIRFTRTKVSAEDE